MAASALTSWMKPTERLRQVCVGAWNDVILYLVMPALKIPRICQYILGWSPPPPDHLRQLGTAGSAPAAPCIRWFGSSLQKVPR